VPYPESCISQVHAFVPQRLLLEARVKAGEPRLWGPEKYPEWWDMLVLSLYFQGKRPPDVLSM
jgi:hypothetical protein